MNIACTLATVTKLRVNHVCLPPVGVDFSFPLLSLATVLMSGVAWTSGVPGFPWCLPSLGARRAWKRLYPMHSCAGRVPCLVDFRDHLARLLLRLSPVGL